ncbi:MAG: hypothetical protein AAGA08_19040 [Pseudomonadota bacterium]
MAQNPLDQLYAQISGCDTLAYFDLSTRIVLLKNTETRESQDSLNDLCAEANVVLRDGDISLLASADRLTLYLRSTSIPNDVLCCICAPDTDVAQVISLGQSCLNEITGGA